MSFFDKKISKEPLNSYQPLFINTPSKKEIKIMRELISDIEDYDNKEEFDIRDSLLDCLIKKIELFKKH